MSLHTILRLIIVLSGLGLLVFGGFLLAQPVDPPSPARSEVAQRLAEAHGVEEILTQASQRVSGGDVAGARDLLVAADAQGPVMFALAETYDPTILAAWGARGVCSDVGKAEALYHRALELGINRARARLEALNTQSSADPTDTIVSSGITI